MKKYVLYCFILAGVVGGAGAQTVLHEQTHTTNVSTSAATTEGQKNEAPIVRHADVPLYPPIAKTARLSGTVQVLVTVKDGAVVNAEAKSSAHQILVNAATENVKTWKFEPETNATFQTTYVYTLEKEEAPVPENPRIEMQLPSLVRITARPTKPTCNDCRTDVGQKPLSEKVDLKDDKLQAKAPPPSLTTGTVPLYPPIARVARIEGVIHVKVKTDGHKVVAIEEAGGGHKLLAAAAEKNVQTWEFTEHQPATITVTYRYKLVAELKENPTVILRLPTEIEVLATPVLISDPAPDLKPANKKPKKPIEHADLVDAHGNLHLEIPLVQPRH